MANRLEMPPEQEAQSDPEIRSPQSLEKEKGKSKVWKPLAIAVAALMVVVFLLVGGLAARLYYAPFSIGELRSQVEAFASQYLPVGQSLQIADVRVGISEDHRLSLQLSDVKLSNANGDLLSTPRIDLEVGLLALLKQEIRVRKITILSMKLNVLRDQTGRLLIAGQDPGRFGKNADDNTRVYDPNEPQFVSVLNAMRRAIKPLADEDPEKRPPQILIRNTQVALRDEVTGHSKDYKNVAFAYTPLGEKDNLWRIDFAYDGRHGRIHSAMGEIAVDSENKAEQKRNIQLIFENVSLPDLLPRFSGENNNFNFSSAFAGWAQLNFDDADALSSFRADLKIGKGVMEFGEQDNAYLDSASFRVEWGSQAHELRLISSNILFGKTGGSFVGGLIWPDTVDGNIIVQLQGNDIVLAARDNPYPARKLNQLLLQAHVNRKSSIVTIDNFGMFADGGQVEGRGTIEPVDGEFFLNMGFDISAMPYDLLLHMWPVNIANGARKWLLENLQGGRTTGAHFDVALTESMLKRNEEGRLVLPDDSVQGKFAFEGAMLRELW